MNICMRDHINQSKLVTYKIVNCLVNRKMFVFYKKTENFKYLFDIIAEAFGL